MGELKAMPVGWHALVAQRAEDERRRELAGEPVGRLWIVPGRLHEGEHFGGFAVQVNTKPGRLRLAMMRLVLGWVWEDA